ncbi:hypothetical protein Ae201684P_005021 [Aphanomyces euteiches]|nr:hypothetical protein Ae201684P_005021 [Aphanomyces euteiches]
MQWKLLVKNLPSALSTHAIEALLQHVGAVHIRVLVNKNKKKSALAEFPNEAVLKTALTRLNKMRLADHQISASIYDKTQNEDESTPQTDARNDVPSEPNEQVKSSTPAIFPPLPPDPPPPIHHPVQSTPWLQPAPLAPHLGLHYPPSPLLEYKYPKASHDTIVNVANALLALPKFYTQVLHLMNKMNLPPPFHPDAIPGPFSTHFNADKKRKRETTTDEFIASDEDEDDKDDHAEETAASEVISITAADATAVSSNRKPAKRVAPSKQLRYNPTVNIFHKDDAAASSSTMGHVPRPGVISEAELNRTRLPPQELSQLKHMQGYSENAASEVLYVKNIAKSVDVSDLTYVFGCVFADDTAMEAMKVKLFQEGRLKGQAFIEFPSIELATMALRLVHGVVLDEKPLLCFRKQQPRPPEKPPHDDNKAS